MNIHTTITLNPDEYAGDLSGNATVIAESILQAVGGDKEKDICTVSIQDTGATGAIPPPPPAPGSSRGS